MKTILKNKALFIFLLILCLFMVGCNTGGGYQKKYDEANYTLYGEPTFEKTLTLEEAKQALNSATNYFATAKSYSYSQTIYGSYDSEYNYEGVTKIDVSGDSPKASIELTGDEEFAFYVADNKAYLNYNGYKTSYELEEDLSDIIKQTEASIGAFSSFDSESITDENLVFAGVDKDDTTVIKFDLAEGAFAVVVINDGKIMKVMYCGSDGIEYTAKYDYTAVTVELPSDLSSYE